MAFAAGMFATAAEAARCPSGQIYRVSKKTCMDKGAAIKAGIYKPGKASRKSRGKNAIAARPKPAAPKPITRAAPTEPPIQDFAPKPSATRLPPTKPAVVTPPARIAPPPIATATPRAQPRDFTPGRPGWSSRSTSRRRKPPPAHHRALSYPGRRFLRRSLNQPCGRLKPCRSRQKTMRRLGH